MKNFEKYKTVNERTAACSAFLVKHNEYADIPYIEVAMRWLELEAEKEEPLPCPFCGSNAILFHALDGRHAVNCTNIWRCKYMSGEYASDEEAVAAHNRVARAVQEREKED